MRAFIAYSKKKKRAKVYPTDTQRPAEG